MNKRYCVTRPFDGITINTEYEYLLTDSGEIMLFDTPDAAENYLMLHGFSEGELDFISVELYQNS